MLKIVSNIAVYITTMIKDMQIESYCCERTLRGERSHSNIHVSCIMQGRKSMFKHGGGDNIGENALLGGFGGMLAREFFFKWCNLVRFGVYLDQILSLQNFKSIIFYIKSKYFRYTLASYGIILLKKCLEAFHD